MTDKVVQTIKSEDGKHEAEINHTSRDRFRYQLYTWVAYDEEFKQKLERDGDWHMGPISGLYETAEMCIEDARLALQRLAMK